jgi:HSP20 family molecular chaperone IbpA
MLVPRIFAENLFDDWMDDFDFTKGFRDIDRKLYGRRANREMLTDVRDHEDHYEVEIDLPGFKKDQITLELNDGYLTVTASKGLDKDEKKEDGTYIRQERYAGSMSRSFYVGDSVTETDVKASYESGVLHIRIPKKEAQKAPEKKTILIEG